MALTLNSAEKMLRNKKRLIKRLQADIQQVNLDCQIAINRIESRIRVARTLVDALEKGLLKP